MRDVAWFADSVHDPATASATPASAAGSTRGAKVNAWLVRIAIALLVPAMVFSWRHSRLVALAIAIPFVANIIDPMLGPSLEPNHPARVAVPLASAALGFVAAWRESEDTPAFWLGAITAALGLADVVAPLYFVIHSAWYPVWMNAAVAVVFVLISKGRFPWLTSSSR